MRVLVNALSVTNASGRHVLLGHLSRFSAWTAGKNDFFVLYHAANRDIRRDLGPHVRWLECPGFTRHWALRSLWERVMGGRLVREMEIDLYFTPAGTVIAGLPVPQVSFAQNPWCLVDAVRRRPAEKVKALMQRRAYRRAMGEARLMVFNSEYMRRAYRENAGFAEQASEVIYQGIDEETFAAAAALRGTVPRKPDLILSVSVMAPHKGVETLLRALALVWKEHGIAPRLALVGAWPDGEYERMIRRLAAELGVEGRVEFTGHVSREELHRLYAEARVFCLMSLCESFGIPAVEAQAFGTPVVSSNCCAIPEVCGLGGVYPDPGDEREVAEHLARLLTDDQAWERLSANALENAARFRWDLCSRPFQRVFDEAWVRRPGRE